MSNLTYTDLKAKWKYVDSPWDLLIACEEIKIKTSDSNTNLFCTFSQIMGFWSAFIFPIISLLGITFNTLTIYVFNFKLHDRSRQYLYLSFLAAFDSLNVICSGWMWIFFAKGLPYASLGNLYFFTYNQGVLSCKLHRYFTAAISCSAISIFLLTSLDRCFAIFWPLKCLNIPLKRAWQFSFGVIAASFIFMSPFFIFMGHTQTGNQKTLCWITTNNNNEEGLATFLQIYNVLFSFCGSFQTVAIILVNLALFYQVSKGQKLRDQIMAANCKSVRKEMSACVILLVLSVLFTIGSLPTSIAFMLAFLMQNDTGQLAEQRLRFVYNIGDLGWHLYMVQQCTSGLVYYWKMPNFRKKLNHLFNICIPIRFSSSSMTSNANLSTR